MKTTVGGAEAAVCALIVRLELQSSRKNARRNCDMRRQFIMLEILKRSSCKRKIVYWKSR